jgi:Tfp pilus assembly protein PilN
MPEDISLLPKEVEKKREQEARERFWRRGGLTFLAVAAAFCLGIFIYSLTLNSQLSNLKQDIADEGSKIESLAEVESEARDLEARVEALTGILGEKIYFSHLLDELTRAVPADVAIVEVTAPSETSVSVSGTSRSYVALARFLLNLGAADLFETVGLRSVSLNQQTGEANFDLTLGLVKEGLRE